MGSKINQISPDAARELMVKQPIVVLDIRDRQSFDIDHLEKAQHITGATTKKFIDSANKDQPLLIYCYHGNSSPVAAKYFKDNGFSDVFYLDGGYNEWKKQKEKNY